MKSHTRNIKGDGRRCKLTPNGKIPKNLKCFLRNSKNKSDLFEFLAKSVYCVEKGISYTTVANSSICNKIIRRPIQCTHEKAETRHFVHLKHAIQTDAISSLSFSEVNIRKKLFNQKNTAFDNLPPTTAA